MHGGVWAIAGFGTGAKDQAPVVQKLDSAIHWITQLVLLVFIRWIVIYPVDSAIHCLNNWGQNGSAGASNREVRG